MSAPPPPPGPPPPGPPPPMNKMPKMKAGGPGDGRNDLLKSIQMGKALKKTVTVDKSKPILGKTSGGSGAGSAGAQSTANGRPAGGGGGGGPQLGGLFNGMSGMPKLKSASERGGTIKINRSPPDEADNQRRPTYNSRPNNGGGAPPLTLEEELARKFKRKPDTPPVTADNLKYAQRGPPPQPPGQNNTVQNNFSNHASTLNAMFQQRQQPASTTTPSLSATTPTNVTSPPNWNHNNGSTMTSSTTIKTQQIQTSLVTNTTSSPPLSLLANKSSLFNNNNSNFTNNQTNAQLIQTNNTILQSQISLQTQISSSQTNNVKPIPNYGKPNLAPKPPTQQLLSVKTNGRATVSRHHSMKSPRSPPIAVANPFGTIRNPPSAMSVEAINRPTRPAVPPPRPPTSKPPPPPPISMKSQSQTNLPGLQYSLPLEQNQPVGGSVANLYNGGNMHGMQIPNGNGSSTSSIEAPIIPPHRPYPAPAPPKSNNQSTRAPTPPRRNTSLQPVPNSQAPQPPSSRLPFQNNTNTVNRLVVDLEAKFSQQFHKVTEFPKPPPYLNVEKSYPSRLLNNNMKQSTNG